MKRFYICVLLFGAALGSGCARTQAKTTPDNPPLDMPAPPPREIEARLLDWLVSRIEVLAPPGNPLLRAANGLRNRILTSLAPVVRRPEGALLSGFLIGDVRRLPSEDYEALRRAIVERFMQGNAVLLGTSLLVAWDLLLDPAMSKVTSYWIWGEAGSYYGMPWRNLLGWGVTGLVLFVILSQLAPDPKGGLRFAIWAYGVNFALPLGFCVLNQYWLAVAAGPLSILAALIVFGRLRRRAGPVSSARGLAAETGRP